MRSTVMTLAATVLATTTLAAGLAATPTHAQDAANWPSRPVRFVVPASAGGVNDAIARLPGEALAKRLGQPFVPENIPGAASLIGTAVVAKAPPDGHTIL